MTAKAIRESVDTELRRLCVRLRFLENEMEIEAKGDEVERFYEQLADMISKPFYRRFSDADKKLAVEDFSRSWSAGGRGREQRRHLTIAIDALGALGADQRPELRGPVQESADSQASVPRKAKIGRPEGSGRFRSNADFLHALDDVMRHASSPISQPQALFRLSRHPHWSGEPLDLDECRARVKTLRNWLDRCDLEWSNIRQRYATSARVDG